MHEREKARLEEIIGSVNDLFGVDTTDNDKLIYVNNVLLGKLLESEVLAQQANANSKEQFSNSSYLSHEILNAIMDAMAANASLRRQALDSERVRAGLKDILLGPAQLYESLRERDPSHSSSLSGV